MKKRLFLISLLLVVVSLCVIPEAFAQAPAAPVNCANDDPQCLLSLTQPDAPKTILPDAPGYITPVSDEKLSGRELIKRIVQFMLGFVGAVALLILIIGGYMYIVARGEEGEVTKAKQLIANVVIGIIVILGAYTLVMTLLNFSQTRTGNIVTGQQNK